MQCPKHEQRKNHISTKVGFSRMSSRAAHVQIMAILFGVSYQKREPLALGYLPLQIVNYGPTVLIEQINEDDQMNKYI